jgi:hypothetical protein
MVRQKELNTRTVFCPEYQTVDKVQKSINPKWNILSSELFRIYLHLHIFWKRKVFTNILMSELMSIRSEDDCVSGCTCCPITEILRRLVAGFRLQRPGFYPRVLRVPLPVLIPLTAAHVMKLSPRLGDEVDWMVIKLCCVTKREPS